MRKKVSEKKDKARPLPKNANKNIQIENILYSSSLVIIAFL